MWVGRVTDMMVYSGIPIEPKVLNRPDWHLLPGPMITLNSWKMKMPGNGNGIWKMKMLDDDDAWTLGLWVDGRPREKFSFSVLTWRMGLPSG